MRAPTFLSSSCCLSACVALGMALSSSVGAADRVEYTITELKAPDGAALIPTKINDRGEVVGYASDSNHNERPFLYRGGVMQALGYHGEMGFPLTLNNAGDSLC